MKGKFVPKGTGKIVGKGRLREKQPPAPHKPSRYTAIQNKMC